MKKILNLLVLGLIITGFSSCLKDNSLIGPDAPGALKNIVEFQNINFISSGTSSTYPLYVESFNVAPTGTATLKVNYAGSDAAPEDIAVKVVLDPTAIDKYNTENSTHYIAMPTSLYSLSSLDLVIPKGQRTASITISVKPNQFDFSLAYALAFKITSATNSVISGNFGTVILSIGAKNAYDGVYQLTTSATTSLQPNKNVEVEMVTQSATTVGLSPGLLGTYSNVVTYTVDPTTLAVTVTCPSLGVQTPQDTRSKYDPATKTFTVFWKQGNGNRTFEEKFVYKRER